MAELVSTAALQRVNISLFVLASLLFSPFFFTFSISGLIFFSFFHLFHDYLGQRATLGSAAAVTLPMCCKLNFLVGNRACLQLENMKLGWCVVSLHLSR